MHQWKKDRYRFRCIWLYLSIIKLKLLPDTVQPATMEVRSQGPPVSKAHFIKTTNGGGPRLSLCTSTKFQVWLLQWAPPCTLVVDSPREIGYPSLITPGIAANVKEEGAPHSPRRCFQQFYGLICFAPKTAVFKGTVNPFCMNMSSSHSHVSLSAKNCLFMDDLQTEEERCRPYGSSHR